VDRCQVTAITCSEARITCTGAPDGGRIYDQKYGHSHAVDASGVATYTIDRPWTGRVATVICAPPPQDGIDATLADCESEIDQVTLPAGCGDRWSSLSQGPIDIPSDDPDGLATYVPMVHATARPMTLVDVDIEHTRRRDLTVDVIAADGARESLHHRRGGPYRDLTRRYLVDHGASGTWALHAVDGRDAGSGRLRNWKLRPIAHCRSRVACDLGLQEYCESFDEAMPGPLPDLGQVQHSVVVDEPGVAGEILVRVELEHARSQDLEVLLRAPDGTEAELLQRLGSTGPIRNLSLRSGHVAGVARNGTWTLVVRDHRHGTVGRLGRWTLITYPICF